LTSDPDKIEVEFEKGTMLGRYRIEDPVGQGGMGTVYAAYDAKTNRMVAIKVLSAGISPELRDRFLAECEAQARIRHPNVMPVYDRAWYSEERPYFVMELLYDPVMLADIVEWTRDGSLSTRHPRLRHLADPARLIKDALLPVCRGIAAANNDYGIQHRDLKPDNILIDVRTRRPYVIDFGICRNLDDPEPDRKIVGTPRYLSTEQAAGRVHSRTDVWGLGALLHFVVTGEPPLKGSSPFSRKDVEQRIYALDQAEQQARAKGEEAKARGFAARRAQLQAPEFRTLEDLYGDARAGNYLPLPESTPSPLAAIIAKAMAPTPAERYEHPGELVDELETWLSGGSVHALSEADSKGAAVDLAKRALQRNMVAGVATLSALLVGAILGKMLFTDPPLRPDLRLDDLRSRLVQLEQMGRAEGQRASTGPWDPIGDAVAHQRLEEQWRQLRAEGQLANGDGAEAERARLKRIGARLAARPLEIKGGGSWSVTRLVPYGGKAAAVTIRKTTLTPGAYELRRRGQPATRLYFRVPFLWPDEDRVPPVVVDPGAKPESAPDGWIWLPPDPEAGTPGLLAAPTWITCVQYAEYLDDIPAAKRKSRVPPEGFHRGDPNDNTRWLAKGDWQDRPVTGLSAAAVRAYVAWRVEADGLDVRLPTDAEWQRLAGRAYIDKPFASMLYPGARQPARPDAVRKAPSGARLPMGPGDPSELVVAADGSLGLKPDPLVPMASVIERVRPYEPAAGVGAFRLVLDPR
jgi:serine/threonine protein kinase